MNRKIVVGGQDLSFGDREAEGSLEETGSGPRFAIRDYDSMQPFFMSLPSDSDIWLFLSSGGGLTAGRRDPDHALFPYVTDDRIHESAETTGSRTLLRVGRGEARLWEPFSERHAGLYRLTRTIRKGAYGDEVGFEEVNADLGLVFSYSWSTSERFGLVKRARIENGTGERLELDILDGIQNIMPSGLTRRFQAEFSTLADGYRCAELERGAGLALFRLSSIPTDRAEPNEALSATTVWSRGLGETSLLLSSRQLEAFRRGGEVVEETSVRGLRGAYFASTRMELDPGQSREWLFVADVDADAAAVLRLLEKLEEGEALEAELAADQATGTRGLKRIVAGTDGLQSTRDPLRCWRHYSNALFNTMRGGFPAGGYAIQGSDFMAFVAESSRALAARAAGFLAALPESLDRRRLLGLAEAEGDCDLIRLAREYLPLTFSRRHGDPSRPWNSFSIATKDASGRRIIGYEGNWRDIFQNWEALGLSYPGLYEGMLSKFLDATTADGYNPYRITREGLEWEVVDEADSWSFIGYWGDHQAAYLLRLLEAHERYRPGHLASMLRRSEFVYAQVPYRIKDYRSMLEDPRSTVEFDASLHEAILGRSSLAGSDGKLLRDAAGEPYRACLAEKLLATLLGKLSNFVPEAGIWMNTQRPEWNDANNALVGFGVSVVTACYLRRLLAFCRRLFAEGGGGDFLISSELLRFARAVSAALGAAPPARGAGVTAQERKSMMDALGEAGSGYRRALYEHGLSGGRGAAAPGELIELCDTALAQLDRAIGANKRPDGLYHAYNLLRPQRGRGSLAGPAIGIDRLPLMLEGQVAVLAAGDLGLEEGAELLEALRRSELYRPDQASYLLYPDRPQRPFLERNVLPPERAASSRLLATLLERGDGSIVARDGGGALRFNASLRNEGALVRALGELASRARAEGRAELAELAEAEEAPLLELYEEVFEHRFFTGRSGSFCKYEGLGCVYWRMVSKLLLATGELIARGRAASPSSSALPRLEAAYRAIREGLGTHKSPSAYGAFTTDPYSHTPSFAGVQQPGMTGQAKEDLITRFAELGARVEEGRLVFAAAFAAEDEFLDEAREFGFVDAGGQERMAQLPPGSYGFTICQVLVVAHRDGGGAGGRAELLRRDGSRIAVEGLTLDRETSSAIFDRSGEFLRLDIFFQSSAKVA